MLSLDQILKVTKQQIAYETVCKVCHGSKVELVYGGHGTVLEMPCSWCEPDKLKDQDYEQ